MGMGPDGTVHRRPGTHGGLEVPWRKQVRLGRSERKISGEGAIFFQHVGKMTRPKPGKEEKFGIIPVEDRQSGSKEGIIFPKLELFCTRIGGGERRSDFVGRMGQTG